MHAPRFWDKHDSVLGKILNPFGQLYAWSVASRLKSVKPYQASVPVICVGNIAVGGVGKTPVCLALGRLLQRMHQPFYFLNHGYKAEQQGVLVDRLKHSALDVGDEALLLNEMAHTIVDSNRARGAQLAEKLGAKLLVMDDGFQHPSLVKTFSFVVVDGKKGFGNERVLPAGPLREPVVKGLARADALIIVGEDTWGVKFFLERHNIDLPIFSGHFELDSTVVSLFRGKKVFAFAGIGNPQKFFDSLNEQDITVVQTQKFPDHYAYTRFDIEEMKKKAYDLPILTTEKDGVKVPREVRQNVYVMPGQFTFDDEKAVTNLLKGLIDVGD